MFPPSSLAIVEEVPRSVPGLTVEVTVIVCNLISHYSDVLLII
jgi:hypothetical protein